MATLNISVPTAGVKVADKGDLAAIKKKYGVSDDDFNDMGLAELGARLSGAVKRAIASKKLPATPTDKEVTEFLSSWEGLGGRKGNPLTRYNNAVKAGNTPAKELDQMADEAADYILAQKKGSVGGETTSPSA